MNTTRILVVGSANVDLVTRVPRCPKPGESLIGQSFKTVPGGKGANQAVAAARLGAETYFAGCVGNDHFGAMLKDQLAAANVDVTHVKTHASEPTGTAVILVADSGENSIIVTPSANYGLTVEDIENLKPVFGRVDAVLVQLEIPLEVVEAVLDMAARHKVQSILDAGPAQKVPGSLIEKADILSPNETEAETMTGLPVTNIEEARIAAAALREKGARHIVLKLGARGALHMEMDDWLHVPAFDVDAVDTVAAGDAFTAALAVFWKSHSHSQVMRYACAAGTLATLVEGAQPSMPARASVEAFLEEHGGIGVSRE